MTEEIQHNPEQEEITYSITPDPDLFAYIANNLRPVYQEELLKVQEDGSFKGLQEFHHNSRIGRIMGGIMDQFSDPDTIPDNPSLSLSKEDISYIKRALTLPVNASAVERATFKGKMELLDIEFEKAKKASSEGSRDNKTNFLDQLKSRFKK